MKILCDKPSILKDVLGGEYSVDYSPALDVFTKSNKLLKTLRGLYVSSKLDFDNEELINYIKDCAKPFDLIPNCVTCFNYEDFDNFCKEHFDNVTELKIAYDVETTAAPFLSKEYALAGFSLANCVEKGCYVILDSIDYHNPDKEKCLERLNGIIKTHKMIVFNAQHEYIATKICLDTDLAKESISLDDAYSYALTLKTEAFKADVFKLKLLCHRLLGTDNWSALIDNYIDLATDIAANCDEDKKEAFYDMLSNYGYTQVECDNFIKILQESYIIWQNYGTIPYSLIPSKMIAKYGCYDACYLVALYNYFNEWADELESSLKSTLFEIDIKSAYKDCVNSQVMSAILTMNGIFISDERDEEVRAKAVNKAEKYYNDVWNVKSDITNKSIIREFIIHDKKHREILEKKYLLLKYITELIPDGFEFISTTPTLYSFTVKKKTDELDAWIEQECLKPIKPDTYKILQKHLKPYSILKDEDVLLEEVLDDYINDTLKVDGSLSKNLFKPMSSPDALFSILTRELKYADFLNRVVLFEYANMPEKNKNLITNKFFEDNLLYDFDKNKEKYLTAAKQIKEKVLTYLAKYTPYQEIYEKLVKEGIKSFSSPIISYIYDVFTATGCTVENPKYAAFDFICKLKISRKYQRIFSTFIAGSSGGYESQKYVYINSIDKKHLVTSNQIVAKDKVLTEKPEGTNRVVFSSWYAHSAETGRWKAQVHNVPAGAFCKRRFVSRFKGGIILANDMSQAEVRELAAAARCEKLLETVKNPSVDIHKQTAALAFNVPYDEVSSTQRSQTKQGIFSIVYGRNEQSLAQELFKGDHKAAKRLMDSIFKVYPEIPEYLNDVKADVRKTGYIITRRGAPIYVNPYTQELKDKGDAAIERMCQNYSIQGGASHWCTNTLVNVQKMLDKYNMKSKLICYIHDSIELDVYPEEFDSAMVIMNYAFNELATKQFNVPTASDTVIGVSMGEELNIKRLKKWHYSIEGNASDVEDVLNQFKLNYDVEIVEENFGELEDMSDNISWVFTPRSELRYYDQKQSRKTEFKLIPKF